MYTLILTDGRIEWKQKREYGREKDPRISLRKKGAITVIAQFCTGWRVTAAAIYHVRFLGLGAAAKCGRKQMRGGAIRNMTK
jgi:hypothetical protein